MNPKHDASRRQIPLPKGIALEYMQHGAVSTDERKVWPWVEYQPDLLWLERQIRLQGLGRGSKERSEKMEIRPDVQALPPGAVLDMIIEMMSVGPPLNKTDSLFLHELIEQWRQGRDVEEEKPMWTADFLERHTKILARTYERPLAFTLLAELSDEQLSLVLSFVSQWGHPEQAAQAQAETSTRVKMS